MQSLPKVDYHRTWRTMPVEARNALGALLVEQTLLRFASDVFQGDQPEGCIVYLDADARDEAAGRADGLGTMIATMIMQDLPELFGEDPTTANPLGTDPSWATPMLEALPPEFTA